MPKAAKIKVSGSDKSRSKPLHPNSRKAAAVAKKEHHNAKIIKRKQEGNLKLSSRGQRIIWFRDNLESEKTKCSKNDVLSLIECYLQRYDDELKQIDEANSIQKRQGRQFAAREDSLKFELIKDARELEENGLVIPDLFDEDNVEYLRNWNGELRYLVNIKMKHVTRDWLLQNV